MCAEGDRLLRYVISIILRIQSLSVQDKQLSQRSLAERTRWEIIDILRIELVEEVS